MSEKKPLRTGSTHADASAAGAAPESEAVIRTRAWFEAVVLGYNLCPFAHVPARMGKIRFTECTEKKGKGILRALEAELNHLQENDGVDTTLLILPNATGDFFTFNDFMDDVDELLERLDLIGEFQVVSFHPGYLFADSEPDDPANHTNRSPYPMLHLLREAQISQAVDGHPDVDSIPQINMERLRNLQGEALTALLAWVEGTG